MPLLSLPENYRIKEFIKQYFTIAIKGLSSFFRTNNSQFIVALNRCFEIIFSV